jgi:hypothetical protein
MARANDDSVEIHGIPTRVLRRPIVSSSTRRQS